MNELKMVDKINYWAKRLRIFPLEITRDNRVWFAMYVWKERKKRGLVYNWKKIGNFPVYDIQYMIFHELAHLKLNALINGTYLDKVICEYLAENQALKWLKKYYPKYYKLACDDFKNDWDYYLTYSNKHKYYLEAYSQIKEYQDIIAIDT